MILIRVDSLRGTLARYECTERLARITHKFENEVPGLFTQSDIEWFRVNPPDELAVRGPGDPLPALPLA